MKFKNYFLICLIITFTITACKKSGTPKPGTTGVKMDTDVYIAGSILDANGYSMVTYWKNGTPHVIPLNGTTTRCYATGIAVHDTDVYICGYDYDLNKAIYWKNGNKTTLKAPSSGQSSARANAIAVSNDGTSVYIAGSINTTDGKHAAYWHNDDLPTELPVKRLTPSSTYNSAANTLILNGSEIYIGGYNVDSAVYWKDGNYTNLGKTGEASSAINTMAFKGTELNMAGFTKLKLQNSPITATSWQGFPISGNPLPTGNSFSSIALTSMASGMAANSTTVYIAGYRTTDAGQVVATCWKNREIQPLDVGPNLGNGSQITGIALAGNAVYLCGLYGGGYAACWKNGVLTPLGEGNYPSGIVAVMHTH